MVQIIVNLFSILRQIFSSVRLKTIQGALRSPPKIISVHNLSLIANFRSLLNSETQDVNTVAEKLTRKTKRDTTDITSRQNILALEIYEALNKIEGNVTIDNIKNSSALVESFAYSWKRPDVVVNAIDIIFQTSEGEGLGIISKKLYVTGLDQSSFEDKYTIVKVPKTVVGDRVNVRLLRHHLLYSEAELIKVLNKISSNNGRKDDLVICDKFSTCSGCQLQMLHYEDQLEFKKSIIKRAYKYFYPKLFTKYDGHEIGNVIESPMQYAYRTKLTPHYNLAGKNNGKENGSELVSIGFNNINPTKSIVDVEYCPIASSAVNKALPTVRAETRQQIKKAFEDRKNNTRAKNSRGSTLLLRDSIRIDHQTGVHERVCLTKHKNTITEKIEDFVFQFPASEFFQNNSSILPNLLEYIRFQIELSGISYKFILDTYCGSGFFGIALSKDIPIDGKVFGIEVSKLSIEHAIHNAKLNGLNNKIQFIEGNANSIFTNREFLESGITGKDSIVIMDPSRKGSNKRFMEQLLDFKPKLIVYVSCNVFTQARDLAHFDELQLVHNYSYKIRDIVGFDFFPQTKHVESIAILELQK